jgi:hypothetical protein
MTERSEDMMPADRQAEIAASVAALQDLGPGYDQALAEGLVDLSLAQTAGPAVRLVYTRSVNTPR